MESTSCHFPACKPSPLRRFEVPLIRNRVVFNSSSRLAHAGVCYGMWLKLLGILHSAAEALTAHRTYPTPYIQRVKTL